MRCLPALVTAILLTDGQPFLLGAAVSTTALVISQAPAYAENFSIRSSMVGGFIAYFWCLERTKGKSYASEQWQYYNSIVNVTEAELNSSDIGDIARILYSQTGLSSDSACPDAKDITQEQRGRIEFHMRELLRR
jgi:hypothetical protein